MERKAQKIKELTGFDFYFLEEDKKDILNWGDEISQLVWRTIEENVQYRNASGLTCEVCPFCVYYEYVFGDLGLESKCEKCSYGFRHGCCYHSDSDYQKIMEKKFYIKTMTNEWYKRIIKEIEQEAEEKKYQKAMKKAIDRNFWENWAKEAGEEFKKLKREREKVIDIPPVARRDKLNA